MSSASPNTMSAESAYAGADSARGALERGARDIDEMAAGIASGCPT